MMYDTMQLKNESSALLYTEMFPHLASKYFQQRMRKTMIALNR